MDQQTNGNVTLPLRGDAVDELFAQHYQSSLRTALGILRSKEDSEDAVQTAYCAAFRSLHSFRGESNFKTWITRIVVNSCLLQLRERRTKREVAIEEFEVTLKSHLASPEAIYYSREVQAAHANAVSGLPQGLQDVYVPKVLFGLTTPTVAHRLGLSTAAAKSRVLRARRKVEHSFQSAIQGTAA